MPKSSQALSIVICGYKFSQFNIIILENLKKISEEWEIIFVDNNLDKRESILLKNFLKEKIDIKINYLHCPIAGVGPSRDLATKYCKNELIIYLDVDDSIISSEQIKKLVKEHLKNKIDLTLSPIKTLKNSKFKPSYIPQSLKEFKLEKYLTMTGQYNILLNKKVLKKIDWGYYNFSTAEFGSYFVMRCINANFKVAVSPISIFKYNESNFNSITRQKKSDYRLNELCLFHLLCIQEFCNAPNQNSLLLNPYIFIKLLLVIYYSLFKIENHIFLYYNVFKNDKYYKLINNLIKIKIFSKRIKRKILSKIT